MTYAFDPKLPYFDLEKPKIFYNQTRAMERFKQLRTTFMDAHGRIQRMRLGNRSNNSIRMLVHYKI